MEDSVDVADSCLHSSEEEEDGDEEGKRRERRSEVQVSVHDCSGSQPLLQDSDEEDDHGQCIAADAAAATAAQSHAVAPQPPLYPQQPTQPTDAHNHTAIQSAVQPPVPQGDPGQEADPFSRAPFKAGQDDGRGKGREAMAGEEEADVFAKAPFPRPQPPGMPQADVFLQAPFGRKKEPLAGTALHATPLSRTPPQQHSPHLVAIPPGGHEAAIFGQVAQQPFRPQALAKYSRHFEASVSLQSASTSASHAGTSTKAPLHSWGPEGAGSAADPFISAPFHLKGPQEKP